ncbi:MAG: hypothetical protein GX599_02175 [Chloroflexi bacterium]|nr:hypothetical protein [Chloroflexota bacterium]
MKYVVAFIVCTGVLLAFSVLGAIVGIPTFGIGFIIIQVVLWTSVMPKAWKWALNLFEKEPPQQE